MFKVIRVTHFLFKMLLKGERINKSKEKQKFNCKNHKTVIFDSFLHNTDGGSGLINLLVNQLVKC